MGGGTPAAVEPGVPACTFGALTSAAETWTGGAGAPAVVRNTAPRTAATATGVTKPGRSRNERSRIRVSAPRRIGISTA